MESLFRFLTAHQPFGSISLRIEIQPGLPGKPRVKTIIQAPRELPLSENLPTWFFPLSYAPESLPRPLTDPISTPGRRSADFSPTGIIPDWSDKVLSGTNRSGINDFIIIGVYRVKFFHYFQK